MRHDLARTKRTLDAIGAEIESAIRSSEGVDTVVISRAYLEFMVSLLDAAAKAIEASGCCVTDLFAKKS